MSRRNPISAGRWRWCKTATASRSTSPRAASISMFPRRSWPSAAPNGSPPKPGSSAAMAGCSLATSSRPMRAAISIFSKRVFARRSASRRFIESRRHSGAREARTSDVQLHIGESRDSGSGPSDHPGMTANWEPRTMTKLSDATRDKLKTISTATVATALFKRGFRTQCIQDVHPLGADQPTLVGEAFTLRYMPAREDLNKLEVFRDRAHPQRKAVEDCPVGAVLVMDSRKDARAASAGAILVTRLMQRGVAGVVTDGGFRDSAEIAKLGFPAYHHRPSAPTNLTLHQAIEINGPIGCGDAPVFPGDVILGDSDGVMVIPAHLADAIANEAFEMTAFEDFVSEQVGKGRGIFGLYPATDEQTLVDFPAWRKKTGR